MKIKITPLWEIKNLEEIISATSISVMLVICFSNVVARYVFHDAISWADEVEVCLLAWATFVGSAAAFKRNLHYGMDFLIVRLPEKGKFAFRIGVIALIGATCGFLCYHSFLLTQNAAKVMPYSRLSYKYIDSSAVVGFASMTIYSIIYLVQSAKFPDKFNARFSDANLTQEGGAE